MTLQEDDFRFLVEPGKRRWRNWGLRVALWVGVNLMLLGVIALLVGHLTAPRQPIVHQQDNFTVLDRWAVAFNNRLVICQLAGMTPYLSIAYQSVCSFWGVTFVAADNIVLYCSSWIYICNVWLVLLRLDVKGFLKYLSSNHFFLYLHQCEVVNCPEMNSVLLKNSLGLRKYYSFLLGSLNMVFLKSIRNASFCCRRFTNEWWEGKFNFKYSVHKIFVEIKFSGDRKASCLFNHSLRLSVVTAMQCNFNTIIHYYYYSHWDAATHCTRYIKIWMGWMHD